MGERILKVNGEQVEVRQLHSECCYMLSPCVVVRARKQTFQAEARVEVEVEVGKGKVASLLGARNKQASERRQPNQLNNKPAVCGVPKQEAFWATEASSPSQSIRSKRLICITSKITNPPSASIESN